MYPTVKFQNLPANGVGAFFLKLKNFLPMRLVEFCNLNCEEQRMSFLKLKKSAGFSLRGMVGFSLVELMVVIVIIGILSSMGIPRIRTFIAQSRQGEAKMNVGMLAKLQILHMTAKDKYLSWGAAPAAAGTSPGANSFGYKDSNSTVCNSSNANVLGFNPSGCEEFRYSYWAATKEVEGVDRFVIGAYAPSESDARIYPTCDGDKMPDDKTKVRVQVTINHSDLATADTTLQYKTPKRGDSWFMDDQRKLQSDSIITICTDSGTTGENVGS